MGKELEYKLRVADSTALDAILADGEVAALAVAPWHETQMKTTYFDTPDRRFARLRWMLRRRMEGEKSVVCLKTPENEAHVRGEWQIMSDAVDGAAIEGLLAQGAPQELREVCEKTPLLPVCGAEFLRKSVMLAFSDGSRTELAGDCGILHGATQKLPFTELELELYDGSPNEMLALVRRLSARYGLCEEPLSKAARATQLP